MGGMAIMPPSDALEDRVLVLAPTGRDAPLIAAALGRHGLISVVCRDLAHVCREIEVGAGTAMLAEEGLRPVETPLLSEALRRQPPWSDLPLLILTGKGMPSRASVQRFQIMGDANVTQIERPVRVRTLVSAVFAALRSRRRQYEVRDYLVERQRLLEELQRVAEQLVETDRRKDEFLVTLAHELRNPLAPVCNALQILRLAGDNRLLAEQAQAMMDRQVRQMVRLVDDLLDVSRITRGKVELKKERVALSSVVASAVETSRPLIEAARHELTVSLPAETIELEADPTRIAQVLSNLLNNAAKYTDPGGRIWLTAGREDDKVAVRVRDNGVGIPADMLPRVFDLFMQVDRSIHKAQGGLGVGLSLVRTLLQLHGGTVEVSSDGPGQGSEFTVWLAIAPKRESSRNDGEEQGGSSAFPPLRRVLVVDDNVDAAQSLAMLLRIMGQDVRTAHNGNTALEVARSFRPEIAFLDIGLPGMSGHELARRIRDEPCCTGALLIALTGWGKDEDRRLSRAAGFDEHMTKPADHVVLTELLSRAGRDTSQVL
jgi:signal transduction histidine kinase/ActR/RegA family two-component response regulator